MGLNRHDASPGLREVSILWVVYLLVGAEVFATYARLPVHELYHVSHNGRLAGVARVVVFLNWPVALAAIPMLAVVATVSQSHTVSRLAVIAAILCGAIFWPGMVDQANLDAKWPNAIAAVGVVLALVLPVGVLLQRGLGPRTRARGDRLRLVSCGVLVLLAVPWLAADLGFLVGRWPLLGSIYYSDEWYAPFGHARPHQAVHAGNHHGLVGALFVVTVLLLSRTLPGLRPRLRAFVGAYLAVLLLYGLALVANDFWLEQIVKRGLTHWEFPSLITPTATLGWFILLVLAALVYVLVFRGLVRGRTVGGGTQVWAAGAALAFLALISVGLAQRGTHRTTPGGFAAGIAFAAAPGGTSHIYETRSDRVVQLTRAGGSDLAPAWSPDHHRIAFQSNRDGNWEIYVTNAEGTRTRRLTNDPARDGEPGWSPDGTRIVFTRDGDLYEMASDGSDVRSLENPGEWPTWSSRPDELASDVPYGNHYYGLVISAPGHGLGSGGPADNRRPSWSRDGRRIALECRRGEHWHICVLDRSGRLLSYLTPHDSNALAPSWSPDGTRIAFISDRDGADQLFVMNADGTHVVRLTHGLAEKDSPTWARR